MGEHLQHPDSYQEFPVSIETDTLTTGDCFYSGLYLYANKYPEIVTTIQSCLQIHTTNQDMFIESFRNKIAELILAGQIPSDEEGNTDLYTYLISLAAQNSALYKLRMESYPRWFVSEYGIYGETLGSRQEFIVNLASHVRQRGQWVGEIEVTIVKDLLAKCGIELQIHHKHEQKLPKIKDGKLMLHLYNPNEQHYQNYN